MQRISPPILTPLGQIGIAAPASLIESKLLSKGAEKLAATGYRVNIDPRLLERDFFHAGTDKTRATLFHELAKDPTIRAIWCARGGYGVTRILPFLDAWKTQKFLQKYPKVILGYSDITALQLWAWKHLKLKALHAPLIATQKWLNLPRSTEKILQNLLQGSEKIGRESYTSRWRTHWLDNACEASGIILGGNLTLLTNLLGTPWQPDLSGSLLFLEDCAEPSYKIDRMLTQLRNAGALKGVQAILAGDFEADAPKSPKGVATWKQILARNLSDEGIPVLYNLPVGHGLRNEPLPLGVRARITKGGKLELLEHLCTQKEALKR